MSFVNLYKPPAPQAPIPAATGEEPFDINFAAPFPPSLESSLVKLVPFIPSLHIQLILDDIKKVSNFFGFMPLAFSEPGVLDEFLEEMHQDPTSIVLTIIDKTKPDGRNPNFGGSVAGILGLYHTSFPNLVTEIGPAIITPSFQRTHVSTHSIGILLRWCLELPSAGGLGLRRAQWSGNPENAATVKVAKKMGMVEEGIMRWNFVVPEGNLGEKSRDGDPLPGLGRDSMMLAVCWDDWEERVRDHVDEIMKAAEARLEKTQ